MAVKGSQGLCYPYNSERPQEAHSEKSGWTFFMLVNPDGRSRHMSYRKVSYAEQCWYIVKFWLRDLFRKRK